MHRITTTFSSRLLKAFAAGESKETAFGVREALRLSHHLQMMPHIISDECTPSYFGHWERGYFKDFLQRGLSLREELIDAHRVTAYLDLDNDPRVSSTNISLLVEGFPKGRGVVHEFQFEARFHHRFGDLVALRWWAAREPSAYFALDLCQDCHERMPSISRIWDHHPGCPMREPGNVFRNLNFSKGQDDGYANRDQQTGDETYNLGYNVGGLTYQADLALGRITPSM